MMQVLARCATAVVCMLALVRPLHAAPRSYVGPGAVVGQPAATEPVAAEPAAPAPSTAAAAVASPPLPRVDGTEYVGYRRPPMVVAGVAMISLGLAGYVAMVAGLAMGANADTTLAALGGRADIAERRKLIARGELGNRLAIGAGVAAGVALATGIALVVIGRRRAAMTEKRRR